MGRFIICPLFINMENFVKEKSKVALILCIYRRLENLSSTMISINRQTNSNFDLYVSNNTNGMMDRKISSIVQNNILKNNYKIYNHYNQHKQFSRFLIARDLASDGYEKIIFIDDDEIIPLSFIQDCIDQYEDNVLKSFYAHKIVDNNYWRKEKLKPGEYGHYAGTGGLICSSKLFLDEKFFDCPEEYYIIDDLWLSYYCVKVLGYKIKLLQTNIEFIKDTKATAAFLRKEKQEFTLKYLID